MCSRPAAAGLGANNQEKQSLKNHPDYNNESRDEAKRRSLLERDFPILVVTVVYHSND